MSDRPRFSQFRDLSWRELAGSLVERLPELRHSLRQSLRHPRQFGTWLEEHNPWLSRQVLSAASNLADPYLVGMGLTIERLDENGVDVRMPDRWRNRGEGGAAHVGALTTLAEFASRVYWERNLNLNRHDMHVVQLTAQFLAPADGDIRAVMGFSEGEREAALFRFRAEGEVVVPAEVKIFESQGRLIADIVVEWRLTRPLALGAPAESDRI